MNILQVAKFSYLESYGGIEQVIKNIVLYTTPLGCRHTLLVLSDQVKEITTQEFAEVTIVRFPMSLNVASCPMSLALLMHIKPYFAKADIVHYHFPWPFGELLHILFCVKKPSLVTYHSDIIKQKILKQIYDPLMQKFLASMDKIVATSENYLQSSPILQRYLDKTVVIPIGIDIDTYPKPSNEILQAWRKKLPEKFILFVGVLRYYKGVHILLEAVRGTAIPLIIVGAEAEEIKLKQQATGMPNVQFLGALNDEDKVALFTLAQAVILPSHLRSEALGISLVEGAMFAKPMISTEIGTGTSFVNENNVTGFVVPANNPDALKHAMLELLNDDELAKKMGTAAKQRYEKYFTATDMGKAYYQLYQELFS